MDNIEVDAAPDSSRRPDTDRRLVVCLVADEQTIDRFPTTLRYLQIGLIDESIHTVLVLPQHSRAASVATGPTTLVTHRTPQWPLSRWIRRSIVTEVQTRIAALNQDAAVLVHCLAAAAAPLATELAAALRADLLLTISSTTEANEPEFAPCLGKAAAIIAPSYRLRSAIATSLSTKKPVEVIRLGATAANAPAAFSTPQLAPALVFAGALSFDCGVDLLLRAVKAVLRNNPNLLLFIIGKGPAENRFRSLVEALDLRQTVTFTGRIEHWQHALEAADIFCLPAMQTSLREEPIHALAVGLAVVAADDCLYDGLIDGQTALLFPDGDELRLARQIRQLLDQPERARSLAATAQARARTDNSVAQMVADHVRIYRQLENRGQTLTFPNPINSPIEGN